jgi:hypothetical protein
MDAWKIYYYVRSADWAAATIFLILLFIYYFRISSLVQAYLLEGQD